MNISAKTSFLHGHKKIFIKALHYEHFLVLKNIRANPTSVSHWCACKRFVPSTEINVNKPAVIRACWQYRNGVNYCNLKYAIANYSRFEGYVVNAWCQRIMVQFIGWLVVPGISNHELSQLEPYTHFWALLCLRDSWKNLYKCVWAQQCTYLKLVLDFLVPCDTTLFLHLLICLDKPGRV